ncbi:MULTISPECIES: DUF4312 family protein [unclassified Paenibacillus]|uniref:DUF4312 family protein n=1 Tax=unclassified Paenibacillus TaxID=185978 RepID=UPI00020D7996|nr:MULTISPECIES: DUF4312 family protein [unclassified Paenibacillus]EGL13068.1 EF_0831/AHA_3912 family protein [Paenibacillus sp. HGF7]EPD80591.1 hypothetical protein HMPREF1207_04347 [Paenibacillus sp. HGH0039]
MFQEKPLTLVVSGMSETKQGAFQQALTRMKSQISKETSDVLLQIEPQDVEVVSAHLTQYSEKFLGFLFPRTRTRYEVTLRITVKLKYVNLSEVEFTENKENLSKYQRLLHMR